MRFSTHLIQRKRGPEIAQYTDGLYNDVHQPVPGSPAVATAHYSSFRLLLFPVGDLSDICHGALAYKTVVYCQMPPADIGFAGGPR